MSHSVGKRSLSDRINSHLKITKKKKEVKGNVQRTHVQRFKRFIFRRYICRFILFVNCILLFCMNWFHYHRFIVPASMKRVVEYDAFEYSTMDSKFREMINSADRIFNSQLCHYNISNPIVYDDECNYKCDGHIYFRYKLIQNYPNPSYCTDLLESEPCTQKDYCLSKEHLDIYREQCKVPENAGKVLPIPDKVLSDYLKGRKSIHQMYFNYKCPSCEEFADVFQRYSDNKTYLMTKVRTAQIGYPDEFYVCENYSKVFELDRQVEETGNEAIQRYNNDFKNQIYEINTKLIHKLKIEKPKNMTGYHFGFHTNHTIYEYDYSFNITEFLESYAKKKTEVT